MLCLSLLWRWLLVMAISGLITKSSSVFRAVGCLQALVAVTGSPQDTRQCLRTLQHGKDAVSWAELFCECIKLPCKQNSTAEHSPEHPPCRAARFAWCRRGRSMQREKKPNPFHTDEVQDEVQKNRCVIPVGDLVSAKESQAHGVSHSCWDWQESSSQWTEVFPPTLPANRLTPCQTPSTLSIQEDLIPPWFSPASSLWSVSLLGGYLCSQG